MRRHRFKIVVAARKRIPKVCGRDRAHSRMRDASVRASVNMNMGHLVPSLSTKARGGMSAEAGTETRQLVHKLTSQARFGFISALSQTLCSQNVVVHRRRVTFHLMQPMLDHITDRYDSDQLPLVDHGDVAGSSLGHAFHDV